MIYYQLQNSCNFYHYILPNTPIFIHRKNRQPLSIKINFIDEDICQINDTVNDIHGVMTKYGHGLKGIINLCGGVPSKRILFIHVDIQSVSNDTLVIQIITDLYRLHRTINFSLRTIFNDKMVVFNKYAHIGTSLFLNQVKHARLANFRKLSTTAVAPDGIDDWDGYYRWARLGYQMNDWDDMEDLQSMLRYFPRAVKDLSELVLSEDGYSFWKLNGFTWTGEFILINGSKSMIHLEKYLQLKQINFIP